MTARPTIAVFSGPTATIQNTAPLVTSDGAARGQAVDPEGGRAFAGLRAQRLATPVEVYVEAFSAHPLERDAADLYAPPDGYVDGSGAFAEQRRSDTDTPVYKVRLRPEDGLYLLPYVARQADGSPWVQEGASADADEAHSRQTFFPDASRLFEEIDRFGLDATGRNNMLARLADYAFVRAAPSGGYRHGLPAQRRTDLGEGDIPPETRGRDYFGYVPEQLAAAPRLATLAELTNTVQATLDAGDYAGAIWLEGSPAVEETAYWLGLLIDTDVPICGVAAQRRHGTLSSDAGMNLVNCVTYIRSGIWRTADGRDGVGAVLVQDEQVFAARDVQKADDRPGGYTTTGGLGGVVGNVGLPGEAMLTYRPTTRHTCDSEVRITRLPDTVPGVALRAERAAPIPVRVRAANGQLDPQAMPVVSLVKHSRYALTDDEGQQVEIRARIRYNLAEAGGLAGFVLEGSAPFAKSDESVMAALREAVLQGMPVVCVSRGNVGGPVPPSHGPLFVTGSNLTATKARMLLMACLLRFGALPPVADPSAPDPAELAAITESVARYQHVFDTH